MVKGTRFGGGYITRTILGRAQGTGWFGLLSLGRIYLLWFADYDHTSPLPVFFFLVAFTWARRGERQIRV